MIKKNILVEKVIVDQTIDYVKKKLQKESSGHDFFHAYRVWKSAIKIASVEGGDMFTIQLAALLHDISDWKFSSGDILAGPREASEFLTGLGLKSNIINPICDIIEKLSFKGESSIPVVTFSPYS